MNPTELSKQNDTKTNYFVRIIGTVKSLMGFFVLVILVAEGALGVLAAKSEGQNQLYIVGAFILILLLLIFLATYMAIKYPYQLQGHPFGRTNGKIDQLLKFRDKIIGHWWEEIHPSATTALSWVEVSIDPQIYAVRIKGNTYDKKGNLSAHWESTASCLDSNSHKVFYYWIGYIIGHKNLEAKGFGEFEFDEEKSHINKGFGLFSDQKIGEPNRIKQKDVTLKRCTDFEQKIMHSCNDKNITELVQGKLGKT